MKKELNKYYDILTTEGANEATILLYGYIGPYYDWDDEKGFHQAGVKDIDFVQELDRLAASYPVIHIRINSPGGEIFHGAPIVNAIRQCKAEVNTWIDGVAASMAGVIWLAGQKRHMAKNGMLMIHSASGMCWGNAQDMRETGDILSQFDNTLIISIADSTGMSEDDVRSKYLDYKDHWLTYADVNAEGWLSAPDEYEAQADLPKNMTQMEYHDLVKFFNQQKQQQLRAQSAPGLFDRLRATWTKSIAAVAGFTGMVPDAPADNQTTTSIINATDMTLEDFKKSLTDGSLVLEEVQAHLATLTPAPAPEPAPAAQAAEPLTPVASAPAIDPATQALLATLRDEVNDLRAKVVAYGQQPAAGKSAPGMPDGDPPAGDGAPSPLAELNAMNAKLAAAAGRGERLNLAFEAE